VSADNTTLRLCSWPTDDPEYVAYHDEEWGVPIRDSQLLFEKLTLDGFQAGLSWLTILRKRANFRNAFDGFKPEKIAEYTDEKFDALMADAGIVRNRAKIAATIGNAQAYLAMHKGGEDFSDFLWGFVGGEPIRNTWKSWQDIAAETPESKAMSKALKAKGFKFVGPTICYAFMQAVGMVNDHQMACFRYDQV
jgi:DNA-3-methyladenine glycosylase I